MNITGERFGLSAAMTTPFRSDGTVDLPLLVSHARRCLSQGCSSVTALGTTGEGASVGFSERAQMLAALVEGGIEPGRIVACVAASAVADAVAQIRLSYEAGVGAILLPPPYYFKGVSDDGIFAWFESVLSGLGSDARGIILYNIPSVTQVPLSVALIGRVRQRFPGVVRGVKDSSGDWAYTQQLLAAHGDVAILIGDERYLAEGVRKGGQGAISGLANVCPEILLPMIAEGAGDERVKHLVEEVLRLPVTPAVKALVAHRTGEPEWGTVRPPLVQIPAGSAARLCAAYDRIFASRAA